MDRSEHDDPKAHVRLQISLSSSCFRGKAEELARDGMQSGCITETKLQQVLSNHSVPLEKGRDIRAEP